MSIGSSIRGSGLTDYPGHIFLCKIRYGYGTQQHIEKLEILHNWYSDVRAYLPTLKESEHRRFTKTSDEIATLLNNAKIEIDKAYTMYSGTFEGQTCDPKEKDFIKVMRAIKEILDEVTAATRIIEKQRLNDEAFEV